jgi:hypothetical protein
MLIMGMLNKEEEKNYTDVNIETHEKGEVKLLKRKTRILKKNLKNVLKNDRIGSFSISKTEFKKYKKIGGGRTTFYVEHSSERKLKVETIIEQETLKLHIKLSDCEGSNQLQNSQQI